MQTFRSAVLAAILLLAGTAGAQPPAVAEQPLLGSTLSADLLRDLPTANNVFAVPETIQLETVSDLFTAGGLNVATAPRIGGYLNSWTQTQYRVGDLSITDPRTGGTPLLLPFLPLWSRVTIATGAMGIEDNASGVSIALEPPRPGAAWSSVVDGWLSGSPAPAPGAVPAIDRVSAWQDGTAVFSGPITERLGIVAAGTWRHLAHVAAPGPRETTDHTASGFGHLVFAATPRDEIRALGWVQEAATETRTDTALHLQGTWERRDPASFSWRLFGGYTSRDRTETVAPSPIVVDSLDTDPVSDLVDTGAGATRRWVAGARIEPLPNRFLPSIGADIESSEVRVAQTPPPQIREVVNGAPARLWNYETGGGTDVRQLTAFAAYANEHITAGRLTLDAGLRLDTVSGQANGAARGVSWKTWLPRGMLRFQIFNKDDVAAVAAYRRTAYQMPLNVLAIGDPSAPFADVSAWHGGFPIGPLIARVGPGTGGDATLTQIDSRLERPVTDELVLGLRARPRPGLELQLTRVTKRETSLLQYIDTGVLASEYTAFQIPDPSFVPGSPVGAAQVTALSRPAGAYGRDRYLLTNRIDEPATSWALEATVRASTETLELLVGLGLTEANGPAAAVGFLATENDQDVLGNMFVDPNAQTKVRGQLFQDRSHIGKIAVAYHLPWRTTVGAIFRYADGQPFTRVVVAPALTQGPIAVRSYANGGSAFTFVGTIDVRVQKAFTIGRAEVAAMLDVYNLPNLDNEVVEYVVSGPRFRTPTALQPPRTAAIGLRVAF